VLSDREATDKMPMDLSPSACDIPCIISTPGAVSNWHSFTDVQLFPKLAKMVSRQKPGKADIIQGTTSISVPIYVPMIEIYFQTVKQQRGFHVFR
jgi:hypothetical protein